jgi:diguanylate cyclase
LITKLALWQQKMLFVFLSIGIFVLLILGLVYPLRSIGYSLDKWEINKDGQWQEVNLPFSETLGKNITILDLRTSFSYIEADTLVIPRQSGNAIEVRLNGKVIYLEGDLTRPSANLWNYVHLVRLPEPLEDENTIEIRISSSYYATGLNWSPYLSSFDRAAGRVSFMNWIYNDFLVLACGAALIIGLILIILSLTRGKNWSAEILMGLALVLSVIYIQDAIFRISTGSVSQFLWVKKVIFISGYLSSLCFACSLEKRFSNRFNTSRWFVILTLISVLVLMGTPDLYSLSSASNFTNAILFINLLFVVMFIIRRPELKPWLLLPAALLSLSIFQMLVSIPFKITWPLVVPYAILITTLLFGVNLILEFNQLFRENLDLQRKTKLDPLTGAMNRRVIKELHVELHDFIVLIDLDDFKELNDRYGHAFGDKLLVHFTETAQSSLRQNDLVIRWGGDEFALILDHVAKTEAGREEVKRILNRIQAQYALPYPELNLKFSFGIEMVNGSVEQTLERADLNMYQMKKFKRLDELTKLDSIK